MQGPSARVLMAGEVDLASETQKLRVRVTPHLTESLSDRRRADRRPRRRRCGVPRAEDPQGPARAAHYFRIQRDGRLVRPARGQGRAGAAVADVGGEPVTSMRRSFAALLLAVLRRCGNCADARSGPRIMGSAAHGERDRVGRKREARGRRRAGQARGAARHPPRGEGRSPCCRPRSSSRGSARSPSTLGGSRCAAILRPAPRSESRSFHEHAAPRDAARRRFFVAAAANRQPGAVRVAAVQMASGPSVEANLKEAARLIEMAVEQGAKLVALPE